MSDEEAEVWKGIPGYPGYQSGWDGHFRSLDRVSPTGRSLKGQSVPTRLSNKGYPLVDLRDGEGKRVTRSAHTVMLETFAGKCPEGMEARHLDDVPDRNTWRPGTEEESRARGGNLFWGTKEQNREDRRRNGLPPAPKPEKDCLRCAKPFEGNGKRCHPCVVDIGRSAAEMLTCGQTLAEVAKKLDYPSPEGIHTLAVRYGRYGARKSWWTRHVTATVRDRMPGKRRSRAVTKRPSPAQGGAKGAPEGRKSVGGFRTKPGHSGHSVSQEVTQSRTPQSEAVRRDRSAVTEGNHHPYPADLVRDRRARGSATRRSR